MTPTKTPLEIISIQMVTQSHDIRDELGSVDTKRKDLRNELRAMTSGCRDQDKQQRKPWRRSQ